MIDHCKASAVSIQGTMATPGWFDSLMSSFDSHACDLCPSDGQTVDAVKFCVDCRQHLCQGCLQIHDTINKDKNHALVDSDHAEETLKDVSIETREVPSYEIGPNTSSCDMAHCAAISNRQSAVDKPHRNTPGIRDTREYSNIKKQLHSTSSAFQLLLTERQTDQDRLAKQAEKIKRDFKEFRLKWKTHLDELEKKAMESVKMQHALIDESISQSISKIRTEVTKMDSKHHALTDESNTPDEDICLHMKTASTMVECGQQMLNEMKAKVGKENLYFAFNPVFTNALNESKSLGDLTEHSFQAVNVREIDDDLTCRISSMCSLDDGSTIMADNSNSSLKRFSPSLEFIDSLSLPAKPFGMCQIDKDSVAVSFPFMYRIQFVSIGKSMTLTTSFKVGGSCHGLAFSTGELFIACPELGSGGRIEIYTTSSQLLRTIPKSLPEDRPMKSPEGVVASCDGSKVFVADYVKGLVILDRIDCHNPVVLPHGLNGCLSVCTGSGYQVFVCGYASHNICKLSSDGQLKEILSRNDGIRLPCTIHVDRRGTKLMVGMRLSDVVMVYDL